MKTKEKKLYVNLVTYGLLAILFIVLTLMINNKSISLVLKGQLIPICCWIVMAVSLNLVVGISGELSLGHAGFMGIGAFTGIIVSGWMRISGNQTWLRKRLKGCMRSFTVITVKNCCVQRTEVSGYTSGTWRRSTACTRCCQKLFMMRGGIS